MAAALEKMGGVLRDILDNFIINGNDAFGWKVGCRNDRNRNSIGHSKLGELGLGKIPSGQKIFVCRYITREDWHLIIRSPTHHAGLPTPDIPS